MKISRSPYDRRRRSPLPLFLIVFVLIIVLALGWLWKRGGSQAQTHVEIVVPAERLGH